MSIQEIVESQMDQEALLLEVTKWNNRIGRYQDENRELLKTVRRGHLSATMDAHGRFSVPGVALYTQTCAQGRTYSGVRPH